MGNDILMSWPHDVKSRPRDAMLREQIFLEAMRLIRKQTCVTIEARDYQRWIY